MASYSAGIERGDLAIVGLEPNAVVTVSGTNRQVVAWVDVFARRDVHSGAIELAGVGFRIPH